MVTIFDKEEWAIRKDSEHRVYCAAVDNSVSVHPEKGKAYRVFIAVPSYLFKYLKEAQGVTLEAVAGTPLRMYLEQVQGVWILGINLPEEKYVDLWTYKDLPGWAYKVS